MEENLFPADRREKRADHRKIHGTQGEGHSKLRAWLDGTK